MKYYHATKWVEFNDGKSGTIVLGNSPMMRNPEAKGFQSTEEVPYRIDKGWDDETAEKFCHSVTKNRSGVKSIRNIPYPADPILFQPPYVCEDGEAIFTPNFCYRRESCLDRTSCPTNPSCTS